MAIERVDVGSTIARATSDRREAGARSASADGAAVLAIQNAPLLDKRDLARFSRLGRTMDAALRFQSFRPRRDVDPRASRVFHSAYEEIRRLLDLTSRNVIGEINPTTVFQASSLLAAADFAVENERASYSQTTCGW